MYEPGHRSPSASKVLDPGRLVSVFGDDTNAIREILAMAVDSLKELAASLGASLDTDDVATAKASIHEIKGVSANVGAEELAAAAVALETELSRAHRAPVADLLAPIERAYERFATEARTLIDRL